MSELTFHATADAAVASLVSGYIEALTGGQDALMLAVRRGEVEALNAAATRELAARGRLAPSTATIQVRVVDVATHASLGISW